MIMMVYYKAWIRICAVVSGAACGSTILGVIFNYGNTPWIVGAILGGVTSGVIAERILSENP